MRKQLGDDYSPHEYAFPERLSCIQQLMIIVMPSDADTRDVTEAVIRKSGLST